MAAPRAGFGPFQKYASLEAKAAALLYASAKTQACVEGNKRLAAILVSAFLRLNGAHLDTQPGEFAEAILRVAESEPQDRDQVLKELTAWMRLRIILLGKELHHTPPTPPVSRGSRRRTCAAGTDYRGSRRTLYLLKAGERTYAGGSDKQLEGTGYPRERLRAARDGTAEVIEEPLGRDQALAALGAIARSAIAILGGPERERLRVCRAPSCGMFYLADRPRQVWCRPLCGNRARVARHYARSRPAAR